MIEGKRIGAIIPAAGKGRRMGGSENKQFLELDGKPIILTTLQHFQSCRDIDTIVLIADSENINKLDVIIRQHNISKVFSIVAGGDERQDSVWNGLQSLQTQMIDFVVVHDGVRPFITQKLLRLVLEAALKEHAVVTAVRPKDTLKLSLDDHYIHETPNRDSLWIAQTPQVFQFSLLYRAFERARDEHYYGTDDASLVERLGVKVRIVEGNYDNIKITTPEDFELARLIAKRWQQLEK